MAPGRARGAEGLRPADECRTQSPGSRAALREDQVSEGGSSHYVVVTNDSMLDCLMRKHVRTGGCDSF